jgi:hypothetical protein
MKKYFWLFLAVSLLIGCRSSIVDDPSTNIQFTVAQPSNVKLTIENSYGTVVATPIDEFKTAGTYMINFDASNLLEGIYFYTLECKGVNNNYYFKSEKMILLIK